MIEFINQVIKFFPLRHEGTKLKTAQRFSASKIKQPATSYQQRALFSTFFSIRHFSVNVGNYFQRLIGDPGTNESFASI